MTIPGLDEAQEIVGRMKITVEMEPDQWYHLTNPENGRTFWTAIERPLVPPKSLGELGLDLIAESALAKTMGTKPPEITIHSHVEYPLDAWSIFSGKPIHISDIRALRRMLYARHLTYDEKCAMWPSVMK